MAGHGQLNRVPTMDFFQLKVTMIQYAGEVRRCTARFAASSRTLVEHHNLHTLACHQVRCRQSGDACPNHAERGLRVRHKGRKLTDLRCLCPEGPGVLHFYLLLPLMQFGNQEKPTKPVARGLVLGVTARFCGIATSLLLPCLTVFVHTRQGELNDETQTQKAA